MGDKTAISWTDHTFNPWMGCTKVSTGCLHCYAETLTTNRMGLDVWGPGKPRKRTTHQYWRGPIAWNRTAQREGLRHRVFCASLADVFDAEAPPGALEDLWGLIRSTPNLDWQLLTKRPERIQANLPKDWGAGWPNVWLGTSVENQAAADLRVPVLARIPAVVRFLSCEPLVGPVDLQQIAAPKELRDEWPEWKLPLGRHIQWVIAGGESGPGFRPIDEAWVRMLRDVCERSGVAFFFKQWGGIRPGGDAVLDGRLHHEFPQAAKECVSCGEPAGSYSCDRHGTPVCDACACPHCVIVRRSSA